MPAIAYQYPEEISALREAITGFIRAEVIPRHDRNRSLFEDPHLAYDSRGLFTPAMRQLALEVRTTAAEAGFYAMATPEDLGGAGMGLTAYFAAFERIFHECGYRYTLGHQIVSHWAKGPSPLLHKMTARMRADVLPGLMSGQATMCFALSEPGAGSDAAMIKTRAVRNGDGWRISGTKIWTTNSPYADYVCVFAITDPERAAVRKGGISCFLVPTNSPGFSVGRVIMMFGQSHGDEAVLTFDEVEVGEHQLIGDLDQGFKAAMLGVGLGRVFNIARAVGTARWALELALEHAKVRETFGRKLSDRQGIMFPLAESAMQIHAAHLMALNVVQLLDRGLRAHKELSMAKAYCCRIAMQAVDRAMQTHGAMGLTNEMSLSEAYIAMRKINIADGTAEIMHHVVAKELLGGDTDL
ncbi:acyl-CoA dehydrogenase family protein [Roseomonas terrae]|uniref:Acyl-CoA dehydrogenase family protein n=1 Tax=Neoroseomonas terrae TaxID=424799 RepID=A0ABS5ELU8_9PROT|nr:acyl-CoA dehydrogenase family protein [Neoroseomonas terrae]MBR0652007.1 acyl-CoA dehydrogenase family protein [Neoroseomonas terrae]